MKKRIWALFLAVMMVVSVLPTSVYAAQGGNNNRPNYPGSGNTDDLFVSAEDLGEAGTVKFRIINGTWNRKALLDAFELTEATYANAVGLEITDNEVIFETEWYTNGNRSGYVYECSRNQSNGSGGFMELFLLNVLSQDASNLINAYDGYVVADETMYWQHGEGSQGLLNNSGDANAEMEWFTDHDYSNEYENIHYCDASSNIEDCFAKETVYILTLTKDTYTITYTDGVEDTELFIDQVYTNQEFLDPTPEFDGNPDQFAPTGYHFARWEPTKDNFVIRDRVYAALWEKNQYTLTINYVYVNDGVAAPAHTSQVAYGNGYSVTSPVIPGYTASQATVSGTMPADNVTVTVTYAANEANYTVKHWFEKLNPAAGEAEFEQKAAYPDVTLAGNVGATTVAAAETVSGFTAQAFEQGTIAADGSTVVNIYYDRNSYTVTYDYGTAPAGASQLPAQATYKYEEPVTVAAAATAPGYTFSGWKRGSEDAVDFNMPATNVTITGSWTVRNDLTYTVKYLEQGTTTPLAAEQTRTGKTFGQTYTENAAVITGYTADNASKSVTITTGTNEIIFYYTKNTHNIVYKVIGDYFTNENYETISSVPYGEPLTPITDDDMSITGYTWSGWSGLPATMPDQDVTVTGSYQINQYAYTVNYYKDAIADDNLLETDTGNANFGTAIPYTNGAYLPTGYTAPGAVSGQTTVTAVAADNVLNIVYSKGTYQYTVEYYFDKVIDNTLTVTQDAVYGTKITTYTDKNKDGYAFDFDTAPITIGTSNNVIKVYYATDEWLGGDDIPDKYQALVTYKVQGGTWDGTDKADKQEVFTLYTKNDDGVWTAVNPAPVLGDKTIPTRMQPDTGYLPFGAWSAPVPYENTVAENGAVYVYSFLAEQEIKFHFNANGGNWDEAVPGYTMNEDLTVASVQIAQGSTVSQISPAPTAPECPEEGYEYIFAGWYAVSDPAAEEHEQNPWNFSNKIYEDDYTLYAYWKLNKLPVVPTFEATLIVNCQDENGASLKYDSTTLADAAWSYTPVETITIGEDKYIYEGITAYSPAQALSGNAKDGETILLLLNYTLDNLNDEEDKLTGGDNIPDKYQALVTYKVVNGTWSDDTSTDILKVFTLKTKEATTEEWTDIEGVALGEMPAGMKPAADYIDKGEWDKTHAATDKPVHGSVYTYTFTTTKAPSISITKAVDGATTVKVGDTVKYTITVTNTGNVVLNNAKVVDELTGDEWTIEVLGVGESKIFNASYKATSKDAGKKIKNIAVVEVPEGPSDEAVNEDVTVKPNAPITPVGPAPKPQLSKADHLSYIIGYDDGTVRPLANITRAEVATIFFRLLTEESRAQFWSQENPFPDVTEDMWCNNAISTMFNAGIITGYPDGTFQPYAPVTRAEFATIAARFSNEVSDGVSDFFDVPEGYWAYEYIALAEDLGWVQGYEGYFRPLDNMTRAEVMTTVNRVLERSTRKENMLKDMIEWPDNDPAEWYYEAVQEATNSHEYYRTDEKVYKLNFYYEAWTKLIENPDWAALERTWSDANSQR